MDNSKIIQLLNTNDTHDIAMILLATDKILKKQFVEHLVFVVLISIFDFDYCFDYREIITEFIFNQDNRRKSKHSKLFCNMELNIYFKLRTKRYDIPLRNFISDINYDLCNPEECVKIMKVLENVAYSYTDWWYKYYITKELR